MDLEVGEVGATVGTAFEVMGAVGFEVAELVGLEIAGPVCFEVGGAGRLLVDVVTVTVDDMVVVIVSTGTWEQSGGGVTGVGQVVTVLSTQTVTTSASSSWASWPRPSSATAWVSRAERASRG